MSQAQQVSPSFVESMDDFFDRTGPMPTDFDEDRRFARFYFRSCAEAIIYPLVKRPGVEPAQQFILTCDLSRSGLRLLHHQQLFPGQRLDIVLNGEAPRITEVVWCKRIEPKRYAIGCRFTPRDGE